MAQTAVLGNQNRSYPDTKLYIAGNWSDGREARCFRRFDAGGIEALREMMFSRFVSVRSST